MKTILIVILALTATSQAQKSFFGSDPWGVSIWHIDHWDYNGIHVDPAPAPTVTPEPSSPLVLLAAAGLALIGRRSRR